MNDLNSQQIVLLCLFVAFFTSIVTGITVVSLTNQSPEPVTTSINRVVERTIEKVVEEPREPGEQPVERIVETIVVNQEDLTVDAVAKNSSSIVRLYTRGEGSVFLGLGVIVNSNGQIITDGTLVSPESLYIAQYSEGEFIVKTERESADGVFAILNPTNSGEQTFSPASFADSQNLKLAQTVINISGISQNTVSTGIITNLQTVSGTLTEGEVPSDAQPTETITRINTSVSSGNVLVGSVLLNLQGGIVGLKIDGDPSIRTQFLPANLITGFINS